MCAWSSAVNQHADPTRHRQIDIDCADEPMVPVNAGRSYARLCEAFQRTARNVGFTRRCPVSSVLRGIMGREAQILERGELHVSRGAFSTCAGRGPMGEGDALRDGE